MEVQAREPQMGLTFEKVWAMFQESDRQMQALRESQREKGELSVPVFPIHLYMASPWD